MTRARLLLPAILVTILITVSTPDVYALSSTLDTDGDGLTDAMEDANGNNIFDPGETDPFNADTDGGGESDGAEVAGKRNPLEKTDDMTYDADGDGWVNGIEIARRTDPNNSDTDSDGILDPVDAFPLDSRFHTDVNSNNLPDEWEESTGLSKSVATPTTVDDPDGDGLTNAEEFARGTNPLKADTDHDGIDDKTEMEQNGDPKENACLHYGPEISAFSDIKNHWAEKVVSRLSRTLILPEVVPIIRGYAGTEKSSGAFHPDQPITRYEFLKMVMLSTCTKIRSNSSDTAITFSDVRKDAPINENYETATKRHIIYSGVHYGFITGYNDATFRPDDELNRAEALKIVSLAAGLLEDTESEPAAFSDVSSSDWFAPYVRITSSRNIIMGYGDGTFRPQNSITRAEAAKIIYVTMISNPWINGYVLPTEE